jgi:cysteine desulfurase/selenocysteine lyase
MNFRKDFSDILDKYIYFDNASTTQKPLKVVNAISDFYLNKNASANRGIYKLGTNATSMLENARTNIGEFFGAKNNQIIFTYGATDSLNIIAHSIKYILHKGDNILLTELEHHSNLLPWQCLANEIGVELRWIEVNKNGSLKYEQIAKKVDKRTKIIAFSACSNVTGEKVDIKQFVDAAKSVNAFSVLDAAQLAPHTKLDFNNLNVDFAVVGAHKMLGPTSIGIIFTKDLSIIKPYKIGGGIVESATMTSYKAIPAPNSFEPGTINVAEIIGFNAAINYYKEKNIFNSNYEHELTKYMVKKLSELDFINLINKNINFASPIFTFNVKGVHPHDVIEYLSTKNICVRTGHHCAKPLHNAFGVVASVRASLMFYNTNSEIDKFIIELKKCKEFFK